MSAYYNPGQNAWATHSQHDYKHSFPILMAHRHCTVTNLTERVNIERKGASRRGAKAQRDMAGICRQCSTTLKQREIVFPWNVSLLNFVL